MRGKRKLNATIVSTLVVTSLLAAVIVIGGGTALAKHPSGAQDVSEKANFTVNFPNAEDHYPGREEQGSIEYFAAGDQAFNDMGAEDGLYYDWIIVHAEYDGEDWIDYSACDTPNTAAFGIDRGNNNSGTNYDQDLIQHRKDSEFRDDGIVIDFYEWEDAFEDPPYMAPEDAIVAAQGEGSAGGPCLTLTDEPGWYRIVSFANGTVNDNARDEQPTEDAEYVEFQLQSNFLYVCECDSEAEARDELGPPPNEQDDSEDTPEPDETATPTEADDDDDGSADDGAGDDGAADDDGSGDDGSADDGAGDDGSTDDGAADDDGSTDDGSNDGADDGSDDGTGDDGSGDTDGTPGADGPGFGAMTALVALLAGALLLVRRR